MFTLFRHYRKLCSIFYEIQEPVVIKHCGNINSVADLSDQKRVGFYFIEYSRHIYTRVKNNE